MRHMKNIDIRIRMGGDDAVAAACEMADLVDERRCYQNMMDSKGDPTDIVQLLRSIAFSAVSPEAGDSASLLYLCVRHAADEIERLRRWIPVAERLPNEGEPVLWHDCADTFAHAVVGKRDGESVNWGGDMNTDIARSVTHWLPLPSPPDGSAPV